MSQSSNVTTEFRSADYLVSVWWAQCYIWNEFKWLSGYCNTTNNTSWHNVQCM